MVKRKAMIKHIRRWNAWRKHNMNGLMYKVLVLFNFIKSPTMMNLLIDDDENRDRR